MDYKKKAIYFIFIISGIRLILAGLFNLVPQEAYYWLYIQRPALSYFDHPPICSYTIGFFTYLFGNKEIFVRLGMILYSIGISYFIFKLTHLITNSYKAGFLTLILLNSTIFFNIESIIAKPDTPLLFFWTLAMYYLYKILFIKNKWKYWILLGIFTGLALYSKYTGAFIYFSVFIILILLKSKRSLLLKPQPYVAFIISIIVFSPVIYWNATNNWASFAFQSANRAHGMSKFTLNYFGQLVASQLYELTPLVFILFILVTSKLLNKLYFSKLKRAAFILGFSIPMISFFIFVSFTSLVKMNWLEPAYLSLFLGVPLLYYDKFKRSTLFRKKIYIGLYISILLIGFTLANIVFHIVPIKKGDTWSGWKTLSKEVLTAYDSMKKQNDVFIFGNKYKIAAELAFYTQMVDKIYAQNIYEQPALQFDIWDNTHKLYGKDAIFVYSNFEKMKHLDLLNHYFDKVKFYKKIEIKYHTNTPILKKIYQNIVFREFYIYKCYNYHPYKNGD